MADKELAEIIRVHQAGQLEQAETGYRAVLSNDPDNADALHLLGVVKFQRGEFDAARELVLRAASLNETDALYFANLGRIETARGDLKPAIMAYRKSLGQAPDQADVQSDLAAALIDTGAYNEALECAERALELNPKFTAAALNMGLALSGTNNTEAAIAAFLEAVRLDDRFAEAWFQLGCHHQNINQMARSEDAYRQVLSIDPMRVDAMGNLGNILRLDGRLDDAAALYDQALSLSPELADVYSNKGVALQELGRRDDSIVCYRRAIELEPGNADAHRNLAMALLQGREFEVGWAEFEWRWKTRHFSDIRRDWKKPQWAGEIVDGKVVLVHAEQGYGDSFQFCRYIPLLADRGARVIVEAPEVVQDVLETVGGIGTFVDHREPLPEFDFHIPMMSFPGAFGTADGSIPAPPSYLSVPSAALEKWHGRFASLTGKRIGIVWKGNSGHSRNLWRSPGIEVLRPLFALDNCSFISLQKDGGYSDLVEAGLIDQIIDLEAELNSFADTAAVIDQLDLIITPDTSVAHLSGAMGKSTWIVLPNVAEWRWGIGREDCPWYPEARLFRQPSQGNWVDVVQRLVDALG